MIYQDFISNSAVSAVALTLYLIIGGIYRLYLSLIAKFPGPKLAALTLWYEFYYDVICGGQYTFKIRRLHEKYSPIIRINPYELHISINVAMQYVFAQSEHRIEAKDFEQSFHYAILVVSQMGHLTKQIPWLLPLMQSLPYWVTVNLYPDMVSYVRMQESFKRLWQDGQITVAAGTVTTAWALSIITYNFLRLRDILQKLKEELATAIPDPSISIPVSTIEQLPYLTACINEGHRLSSGASTRLQRISLREPLHFTSPATASTPTKEYTIPAGTPVSMTTLLLHYNPNTFTPPNTLDPERYIRDPSLTKYLVPFSKGLRHCIGMNLAYAEMYLALSKIFRVYDSADIRMEGDLGVLELYETSDVDVEVVADAGIPLVAKESKGIRLKILKA